MNDKEELTFGQELQGRLEQCQVKTDDLTFEEQLEEYLEYCQVKADELGVNVKYYIEEFELW